MSSHFEAGSGTCRACDKRTRETGEGESEVRLCRDCYLAAGLENDHSDYGHDTPIAGCPACPATPTPSKESNMSAKKQPTNIRDLREHKMLSQDKVAEAAGLTYSKFVRIEAGEGKTTPEEVAHVLSVLKGMEPGTRKLAGRPFKDAEKQAAVQAAREKGESVAEALGLETPAPARKKAPAKKAATRKKAPAKGKSDMAAALAKKPRTKKEA